MRVWRKNRSSNGLYLAEDRAGALAALGRFCDLYDPVRSRSSTTWWPPSSPAPSEILAFHDDGVERISNGRLEGTNNKLQVLRRVAHGFTNPASFEARGLLACPAVRP